MQSSDRSRGASLCVVAAIWLLVVMVAGCTPTGPTDPTGPTGPAELPDRLPADWSAGSVEDGIPPVLYVSWWPGADGSYSGGWKPRSGDRWERQSLVGADGFEGVYPRQILADCSSSGFGAPVYCSIAQGPTLTVAKDQTGSEIRFHYESMTVSADGRYLFGLTGSGFVRWDMQLDEFMSIGGGRCSGAGFPCDTPTAISPSGRFAVMGRIQFGSPALVDLEDCGTPSADAVPVYTCRMIGLDSLAGASLDRVARLRFIGENSLLFSTNTPLGGDGSYRLNAANGVQPRGVVALGDSYSSGEGAADAAFPYLPGTDDSDHNLCHQSRRAWPTQVATAVTLKWPTASFACSGAVAQDLALGQYPTSLVPLARTGQLSQLENWSALHGDPRVLTLTLGGNDAGFPGFISSCISSVTTCADPPQINQTESDLLAAANLVFASLTELRKRHPHTEIYLSAYPRLIDGASASCGANVGAPAFDQYERRLTDAASIALNGLLSAAAEKAGVTFVDVSGALGAHVLCGTAEPSWINGLTIGDDVLIFGLESFHPHGQGQDAWAAEFRSLTGNIGNRADLACTGFAAGPNPCPDPNVPLVKPDLSA